MPAVDPKGYISAILHNGIGRYVCQLQRITLRFCKTRGSSGGIRQFIEHDLLDFARSNPGTVVYLQPVRDERPQLHAEYLNGRKEDLDVDSFSREEVIKWVDYMRVKSGNEIVVFRKNQLTMNPTIQGAWTPWTYQRPEQNSTSYPNAAGLRFLRTEKSATEIVLELAKKQGMQNVVYHSEPDALLTTHDEEEALVTTAKGPLP